MPNAPKTPHRTVRVPGDRWERFGELADPDRSTVLNAFIAWYVRESSAKLPKRPAGQESPNR